uniref:(California timema) hypothetical protein n=1 Tax=Timema californicum TaxID=61474 RepID=A0A7R9JJI0_TIMCA|nr:unnamed protein product [Timema californicum]
MNDSKKSGIGEDEVYTPKLWYFHLLDFLREQEIPRTSVSNLSGNEIEDELSDPKSPQPAEACM